MLNINPEIVCTLIKRAREFHAKEGVVIPEETTASSADLVADLLADHQGEPTFQEFKIVVDDLEPDQQVALVALMWLGRGDFDADEWSAAFEQAGEGWTPHTAEYLLATPLVANYLEEGLAALGYSCEE
jgi:hypothetical protein